MPLRYPSTPLTSRRLLALLLLVLALNALLILGFTRLFAAPLPSGRAYALVPVWPLLPSGLTLGQVSGVAVDSSGQVFVFHRADRVWQGEALGTDPILSPAVSVFDAATGRLLTQWGAGAFVLPHGLALDPDQNLWLTDVGLHQVFKYDRAGRQLMALGEAGVPGDDPAHFNQPTDVAVAPDGTVYVSDGYGNARVVRFSPDGAYLGEWGTPGAGPGQFDVPHGLALDARGRVYVADRGNARLQIFDASGRYLAAWQGRHLGRPWAVRVGADGSVYVVDGGDQPVLFPDRARIVRLDAVGSVLASFGAYGAQPGQFTWPHAIALGPDGSLYIGEVSTGMRVQKFVPTPP